MNDRRLLLLTVVAVAVFVAGLAVALLRGHAADGDPVVDKELLAYLSEARALHHQANLQESANDLPAAAHTMERLVAARQPHAGPEVDEVLADAYARLAELQLRQDALDPAAKAIASGLAHAPEPTYFRGHLVEVQGLVEEARAVNLADAGKLEEAVAARTRAIALLEEVVKIQDQVIKSTLEDGGAR